MLVISACNGTRFVNGWVPYWSATEGQQAYTGGAGPMFSDVSPFFFSAQPDGSVAIVAGASETQLKATIQSAKANNLQVLPTITDGTPALTMATVILADPTLRGVHEDNLVALVDRYPGIDGIDLDYENFAFSDGRDSWASTQPVWDAFIYELAAKLHARGKLLSVTIPPVWISGSVTGYTVYDQAWLAIYADRVRLMVYDWSTSSPGPISPMTWLQQVIAYTNSVITDPQARHKIQLGVPAYGRDWGRQADASERCPDGALTRKSIEIQNMPTLIAARQATPVRDVSGEMRFTYDTIATGFSTTPLPAPKYVPPTHATPTIQLPANGPGSLQPALRLTPPDIQVSCTVRHFVYYPDATSIQQHAQAALDAGWSGVIIWALGYETADVYTALAGTTP
jgi:spore germination protein YaaH